MLAGIMRSEDVELGEDLLVAGYPYGEMISSTIKVTKGIATGSIPAYGLHAKN